MFQTEGAWEIAGGTDLLRSLAGQPDLQQFRMIEIALNAPIYRLDVVLPEKYSKDQVLRRFRLQSLADAVQFIKDANPVEARITQESAFEDGQDDQLRPISAISSGVGEGGRRVFVCESGTERFVVAVDEMPYVGPVNDCRKIWPRRSSLV